MKELAVDCTMIEKIIKILQKQIDLAKDMNRRNIILSVEEAEILIEILGTSTDEELVRCKDCEHGYKCEFDIRCENKNMPHMFGQHFSDNWFCGDGERR